MRILNKVCRPRILNDRKAASPAVSMVIITAATVTMVLVASTFALQALDHQQASSEFNAVQTSFLTFDDAFRDIAFDRGGSRSVRFTTNYGYISLMANERYLNISVNAGTTKLTDFDPIPTGVIKYSIPTSFLTFGSGYQQYVLGNGSDLVPLGRDLGRLEVTQQSNFLTIELDYRVLVTKQTPAISIDGEWINYVDIFVLQANIPKSLNLTGNFDIIAKNLEIRTQFWKSESSIAANPGISIYLDGASEPIKVLLPRDGIVAINLIVADIKISS